MSNPITEDCSCGLHEYCTPCECECHEKTHLNINELKTLWRILAYQYVSYEDSDSIKLVRKIRDLIGENQ